MFYRAHWPPYMLWLRLMTPLHALATLAVHDTGAAASQQAWQAMLQLQHGYSVTFRAC